MQEATETSKNLENSRTIGEQSSVISEQSDLSSESQESHIGEHMELHRAGNVLTPSLFRQVSAPLYTINTGFRRTISHPTSSSPSSSIKRESIQGRQRMSTIDPSTIRRLKSIKVDALKEEDQIEVRNFHYWRNFD